ncbi:MAG: type II toxin-antitoxin system PemK/MazF family toxin [Candidatus Taylorbacteria bacterium]|nr:type II toxin-antitoxin system PemK/MazF family toxin [Candidatus Taylorbacteria bacterium]
MEKDFQKWHSKKSEIDKIGKRPFFHEREIWYCNLGVNVGFEQDGSGDDFLRPVVIVRKFNNEIFWGVPLTKSDKKISKNAEKYYFPFSFASNTKSAAILSQIRLIDARRLSHHIGEISQGDFKVLNAKLKVLLP